MHLRRIILVLLLAIFFMDTVAASISLHLPASGNEQANVQSELHQHHAGHHAIQAHEQDQQHVDNCRNCHDCLSCFSALPLVMQVAMPALPHYEVADILTVIYFPPALALLQRPPISLSI